MVYTIKQIADLAGVTTRTLRFYDQVGLLSPVSTRENGYRSYDQSSLFRLQQILFFRELDVPIKDICLIMSRPDFSLLGALEKHRDAIHSHAQRLSDLLNTIDGTIAKIKGEKEMKDEALFTGFDESKYEEEARQRWGNTPAYQESQRKWAGYSKEMKEAIKAEGGEITLRMVGKDAGLSPHDPGVQAAIGEYHAYINKYFYTCDVEFLRTLANMWVEDARFAVNYERIREGGAEFVHQAVQLFCDDHTK